MAVKPVRRLQAPTGPELYDRMAALVLYDLPWRSQLEPVERQHPELIVRRGDNVLAAVPAGDVRLAYSFRGDRDFVELFAGMFEELMPRVGRAATGDTLRFRLTHSPSRPVVEPVLRKLWFSPAPDQWRFQMSRTDAAPKAAAPKGARLRAATIADAAAFERVDADAFPGTPMPLTRIRELLRAGHSWIAVSGAETAGACLCSMPDPGEGFIHTLAVAETSRGRGVGAALTSRAIRELFHSGAGRVSLTTNADNAPAIALYRKLGFEAAQTGRVYTRPADEAQIERLKQEHRGVHIKFGGWR